MAEQRYKAEAKVAQRIAKNGCLDNHYPSGEGLATSPGRRARLRFHSPVACETKEVPPRLTNAVL